MSLIHTKEFEYNHSDNERSSATDRNLSTCATALGIITDSLIESRPQNLFSPELEKQTIIDIHEVGGSEGIYNVTVLDIDGKTCLLGRKVTYASAEGEPDVGSLVIAALNAEGAIETTTEVWNPDGQEVLLEDPRALQAADGTTIGLTAVFKTDKGYTTRPAIIEVDSPAQLLSGPLPTPRIFYGLSSGDQTTPIDVALEGKNTTTIDKRHFMYRPEGDENNHRLQVCEYTKDGASHKQYIDFPSDIPWAQYRIGTTATPEWLSDSEAFLPFHGITILNGIYVYSIGTARLLRADDGTLSVDNIGYKAAITPDSFSSLSVGDGRNIELHPELRRAVYSCGGTPIKGGDCELKQYELFVNQGDMRTWSVLLDADRIISNWDRNP